MVNLLSVRIYFVLVYIRLYTVPAITGSNLGLDLRHHLSRAVTSNVWMLIFSSSSVKRLILRESWDPLSGILLRSKSFA
jgi:hypothetical protein